MHDPLHSPSHEQVPRRFNALMSWVLGATPLMLNELMSRAICLLAQRNQQPARPISKTRPTAHPGKATPVPSRVTLAHNMESSQWWFLQFPVARHGRYTYTNDLPVTGSGKFTYADNICLTKQPQVYAELECCLLADMEHMAVYCCFWWLKPSPTKTVTSVFVTLSYAWVQHRHRQHVCLSLSPCIFHMLVLTQY